MINSNPTTFAEWQALAQSLNKRADNVRALIVARARRDALTAGLDPSICFLHAHNARCSFDNGRPWPNVDYCLVRRVQWLETRSWEPSRIASRVIDRAWRAHIAAKATCDSRIATVCKHEPKSATFTLSNGRQVIERKMCNGATDVSMFDDVEMTEFEWQEYCQTVIPARWRLEASAQEVTI